MNAINTLPLAYLNDDIWNLEEFNFYNNSSYTKNITFQRITHPWVKPMAKEYILLLMQKKYSISNILCKISNFEHLSTFMEINNIPNMHSFTHKNTLEYITFVNMLHPSAYFVKRHLTGLSNFTQWGAWTHPLQFPVQPVVRSTDIPKTVRKEPTYYTENEIKKIKSILPYADKMTARITLIMIHHGLRYADISKTPIRVGEQSCLTETAEGQFVFEYYMSKTRKFNRIPVSKTIAKVIQAQINSTQRKFGKECNILFATGLKRGYLYGNYIIKINDLAKKYHLTYDDGRPLRIGTKLFRSTYATKLINTGVSPDTVRAVLGHKSITTQIHYATIHGETMISLLAPLTKQDNDLIANIGKVTPVMCHVPDDYTDFVPLPNGACSCAGECKHQNACYTCNFYRPQKEFLSTYKLQMEQAEMAIEEARKYNHTVFMEKNIALRDTLKTIIDKLEVNAIETG